ncbi:MAG: P-type conjugative transfer protein TrbJ [Devosiaceae bacterium]|nr:P-type conjugative transfer protein TrbJ [Devosiaceae bacterium]
MIYKSLSNIDALVRQARNISYQVTEIDSYFNRLYPQQYSAATSSSQIFRDAKEAWNIAREGFQHSMQVQAKVVEQVRSDSNVLDSLITQSQSAIGNLQATQAGNQLLALNAKQTMQLQTLLAASARAVALDKAASLATKEQARAHFQNFLGDSSPYSR